MEKYQAIIVGSGPAGAACAKALMEEDMNVLVIEKDKLPRHKICSGVLFGQTQLLLDKHFGGLPPEDVYCDPKIIKADDIQEWNKEKGFSTYAWELPMDGRSFPQDYYNIWRNRFDYWLLRETGVEYRDNCMFRNYSLEDNEVKVEITRPDEENLELSCSYLIGADGGGSRLRMLLDPEWLKTEQSVVAYQGYHRFSDMGSLKDAHWYVFFEPEIGDALLCAHRKDDVFALCTAGLKGRNLKKSMEDFKGFLAENFNVVFKDMVRDEGCIMRLTPPCFGEGRTILTGESAGIIYLNGEGISAAIDSGYRAGKAVARAIKEDVDAMEIYLGETGKIINHMQLCFEKAHLFAVDPNVS